MDENAVRELLDRLLAPWVRSLGLVPVAVSDEAAMLAAISVKLGEFRPMTTVALNTSFMRAVRCGDLLVTARVLRMGRNLVFGEIEVLDDEGRMAVHATSTYALVN
ncbi:phenylacetic acid degradation protein [Burkholderia gladioli]|uniref:PaaI family thioesterase n=1 Tax=Burkholderia gladioli TaxID=28095 RepID=UPI000752865D|nr:PaaI family thioesterase [Burkholderia gladioli]KVM64426.1 phenylacetic acid degradation protein [Burkholderia gladioli]